MRDLVVMFFSLEADVKCKAVFTASAPADQKQTVDSSMTIQQYLRLLLKTSYYDISKQV